MDQAHLHLLTNHVSLFALAFGALILLLGFLRKSEDLKFGAAILFIIGAIMFFPAKETGAEAARIVKKIATVDKAAIKEHAQASKWIMPFSTALGVLSILALVLSRKKKVMPKWASILMLLLSLFTFSILARTAYLGGFIRHTEIHPVGASTGAPADSSSHDADGDDDGD
jgi:glucan phosphoethanolaminetransferase (alkaline phosphatase superfamily)